jgi:hypothetical protein
MTRTFIGWVALGAVIGFALGAAAALVAASQMYGFPPPADVVTPGQPVSVRNGVLVVGGVAALVGALVGAAAGIAGGWWPPERT